MRDRHPDMSTTNYPIVFETDERRLGKLRADDISALERAVLTFLGFAGERPR